MRPHAELSAAKTPVGAVDGPDRARPARRAPGARRRPLRGPHRSRPRELRHHRRHPRALPAAHRSRRRCQAGRRRRQPTLRPPGPDHRRGDHRRMPAAARRGTSRPVRGRPAPGRRRHLDEHERQRSHRQPRPRAARTPPRRVRHRAPARTYQPRAEHQRRLPDGDQDGPAWCRRRGAHDAAHAAAGVRGQGRRTRDDRQARTHPAPGRRTHDPGPGVQRLRGHAREGRDRAGSVPAGNCAS